MPSRHNNFYDRLQERLDRLDAASLRRYLQQAISEKGFFEEIFDTLREGIIVIDNALRIQVANPAALRLFGMPEDAVGQPIGKFFRQVDWSELLRLPASEWGRFSRQEIEIFYPERRFLSFYLLPAPEPPNLGNEDQLLATLIFHDITERCQDNEKAVETQRVTAITQLAAGVAHELGNPLNALGIRLQILKRKLKSDDNEKIVEATRQFVEIADQELSRLDAIVKNFLSAVRPTQLELTPVNIQELLVSAAQFLEPELKAKDISITLDFPDCVPAISGDAGQLTQAFFNLIKNAMQAMPNGGKLIVSCRVDDVYVHLRFADNGKGLTREELSRLLEAYYTTKPGGHGLGLLIVDRIVRSHGGDLAIDGKPGEGAAFTISLPRHARVVRQLPAANLEN
ncbi:MAG: PAS domain-containing protein [Victivallales bacterium]|nr:PAS domain-containing protein [Victivallales bacterium]